MRAYNDEEENQKYYDEDYTSKHKEKSSNKSTMTMVEYLKLRDAFTDALMECLDAQFKKQLPKENWDEFRKPIFEKHLAKYGLEVKTIEE